MAVIYNSGDSDLVTGIESVQLKIGSKLYDVDNRKSTFDEISKAASNPESDDTILTLALGQEAAKEIAELDISVQGYSNLITLIQAAILGITFEEASERFRKI